MRPMPMLLVSFAFLAACGEGGEEGIDFPCDNGLDDDGDGYYDCLDNGCYASPVCQDTETDVGGGPGGGTPGGGGPGGDTQDDTDDVESFSWSSHLKAVSLRYHVRFEALGSAQNILSLLAMGGIVLEDCESSYVGQGVLLTSEFGQNTYEGTFERVATTCVPVGEVQLFPQISGMALDSGSIYVPASGEAFHTFKFPESMTRITHWVSHEFIDNDTPSLTPATDGQWWMKFTKLHTYNDTTYKMTYDEVEPLTIQGLLPFNLTHKFEVNFSGDDTPPTLEPYEVVEND